MTVFSKRGHAGGNSIADRIQQEIMDSIASLHKTDNFHFAHLLVVMYEADQIRQQYQAAAFEEGQQRQQDDISSALVGQASQKVLQVLIEFILSFIQQNKQSIV